MGKPPQTYRVTNVKGKTVLAAAQGKQDANESKQLQKFQAALKQARITDDQLKSRHRRLEGWIKRLAKTGASVEAAEIKTLVDDVSTVQDWANELLSLAKSAPQGRETTAVLGKAKEVAGLPKLNPSAIDLAILPVCVTFIGLVTAAVKSWQARDGASG